MSLAFVLRRKDVGIQRDDCEYKGGDVKLNVRCLYKWQKPNLH